jgi:hypothetical protein
LDPHPIPPFENTTTTTASPLATGWQKCNRNGNRGISPNEMFSFMSFSFSLFLFFYLLISLDVGFCDDIPLMAARFFFSRLFFFIYSILIFLLRLKTLWQGRV